MTTLKNFSLTYLKGFFVKSLLFAGVLLSLTACKDDSDDPTAKQMKIDEEKIQAYITENNLGDFQTTASGVYFKVTEEGAGLQPKRGDVVSVHYTLFNLAGKQLETSVNNPRSNGAPLDFTLGIGQVIRGWDEGIAQLEEGSKAILLIPSPLAYGSQNNGPDMPANSVLRFDVVLVDIK